MLRRVERKTLVAEDKTYKTVGVRWYGKGAFVRDELLGIDIKRKEQWIVRTGDAVYNKLFAWKGAFAIADAGVDGHIVSDKFPTYEIDRSLVEPAYLGYYFQTSRLAGQALRLSKGAAAISKLTLNPPQFWDLTIPLPSVDEQHAVIDRIDRLFSRLNQVTELRSEVQKETSALVTAAIADSIGGLPAMGQLADVLLTKPRNGWSPRCDNAEGGVPVLALSAVTGFAYREAEFKRTSEATVEEAHYWLRPGDLLITRSNTPDLVGHAAIYNGSPYPCIYPDLMMRIPVNPKQADTRFVHCWLQTPIVREYLIRAGRGTSPTMKKIAQTDVMQIPFPTSISLADQRHLVERVEAVGHRLASISELLRVAELEQQVLPDVILARAYSGRLLSNDSELITSSPLSA